MSNEEDRHLKNEKQLQNFIAENPWLLNPNYQRVFELANGGLEYQIGEQKRIDLVLRDRVSLSPVVVEFKFTPFYRENIGQILEYKARVAISFTKENSDLYRIFKEYVLAPKLALVVEECDDFTRVACNMAGIDIYEYRNFSKVFNDPAKIVTIKNFTESLKNDRIPLSLDRRSALEAEVYRPIKRVLADQNLSYAWREPQESRAYFFPQMANLFLNRWLFADENKISMGLYEDVFSSTNDVVIVYYSNNKPLLERFEQFYNQTYGSSLTMRWYEQYKEGFLEKRFHRNDFLDAVEATFKEELNHYLHTLDLAVSEKPVRNPPANGVQPSPN